MECLYCCDSAKSIREVKDLPPKDWERGLSGTDNLIHLTITGGEPFLRSDLIECLIKIIQITGVPRISINTNGFYTKEIKKVVREILKRFPTLCLTLSVSLDGPEEVHDKLRRKEGSFSKALDTIKELAPFRKSHPKFNLRVSSLLQLGNESNLEAFLKVTKDWPIDFHEIIFPRDIPNSIQLKLRDSYKYLSEIGLKRAQNKYRKSLDWVLMKTLNKLVLKMINENFTFKCSAGSNLVEILSDGRVIGCELEKVKSKSLLGNIKDKRLIDIMKEKEAINFRKKVSSSCNCTFECAAASNTVFMPRNWSIILREFLN
jgi:sulfatase maturation enzyme AslB (radical SAM superfamily)